MGKQNTLALILSALFISACSDGGSGRSANRNNSCPAEVPQEAGNLMAISAEEMQQAEAELFSTNTDRWIVGMRTEVLQPSGQTKRRFLVQGLELQFEVISDNAISISVDRASDRGALLQQLEQNFDIEFVEPDYKVQSMSTVDTASLARQWAHANIGTERAWRFTAGHESVVVAVADSGIDFSHPELRGSEWKNPIERANGRDDDGNGYVDDFNGWNFVEKNNRPKPTTQKRSDYHGTHVAGIIAGRKNAAKGVAGVAPRVKLMSLRFLNGEKAGYTSDAIKSIRYATDKHAKIINASFGSYRKSQAMMNEIKRAQSKGVLIIAAAGNMGQDNDTHPFYPASYGYSNVISVTASSSSNNWVSGINYGTQSVDIAAPGSKILSTDVSHGYVSRTGSSMAAPFVAGVAALALAANPKLSASGLRALLLNKASVFSGLTRRVAQGRRLNAAATAQVAMESGKGHFPVIPGEPDVPTDCEL